MNQANFSIWKLEKQGSTSEFPHLCKTNKSTFNVSQHDNHRLFPEFQRKQSGKMRIRLGEMILSIGPALISLMRSSTQTQPDLTKER